MPRLNWSNPSNRQLEAGLDRGVLYPKNQPLGPEVVRNLATNPSSEGAGTANVTMFTNEFRNPLPASMTNYSAVIGATVGYDAVKAAIRIQVTAGGSADLGVYYGASGTASVTPGEIWMYSVEVEAVLAGTVRLSIQGSAGTFSSPIVTFAAGETKRITYLATHAGVAGAPQFYVFRGDTNAADFYIRKSMMLKVQDNNATLPPYFDGFTREGKWNHSDYTVAWVSSANNSASRLRAANVVAGTTTFTGSIGVRSTQWSSHGSYSLETVPILGNDSYTWINLLPYGLEEGKTYTIKILAHQVGVFTGTFKGATQVRNMFVDITGGGGGARVLTYSTPHTNASGDYVHKVTFTIPKVGGSPVTQLNLRLYNGYAIGQTARLFWDDLMVYEGSDDWAYFDGDTASELYDFYWAGSPHNSSTIARALPSGVVWDGLTSVDENGADGAVSYYIDGRPFLHLPKPREYSATLSAFTFPDEFAVIQGLAEATDGMYLDSQMGDTFDLSYRTLIANSDDGMDYAYKIHLVYNASVVPQGLSYSTHSGDINPTDFKWDIQAVPVLVEGYRATAHVIIDTRHMDPDKLEELEGLIYGDATHVSRMPEPQLIFDILTFGDAIVITDNLDGTWTAEASYRNLYMIGDGVFQIDNVNAVDHGDGTYTISSTP